MSRRIVQLAAVDVPFEGGNGPTLFALDNNGVAWVMWGPRTEWIRLPALPSIDNLRPRLAADVKGAEP